MRKARIYFWFQGALHKKRITGNTVDADIDCDERFGMNKNESARCGADEALEQMITNGLVDFSCDCGVSDFGVEKVEFKFKGEAGFKY